MVVVDVIVAAVLVVALVLGIRSGLLSAVGTLVGLVVGAFVAFWVIPVIQPLLADLIPDPRWRSVVSVLGAVGIVATGVAIGSAVGRTFRRGVDRTPLRFIERLLGGALSLVIGALAVSLVAQTLVISGIPGVSSALSSSRIIRVIDDMTPSQIEGTLAEVRGAFLEEGLPRLGDLFGTDLEPQEAQPAIELDDPELSAAAASVARVSGVAYACGTSSTGSGFVVVDDRVVTNAHVVAGVEAPVVEFPGGLVREGRVVYFDPVDDLAVIAVDDLDVTALAPSAPLASGAEAAVLGYPYGGPFETVAARVLSVGSVPVPDIYDASSASREILALQAAVRPGNSGGPLVTGDGQLAGVVFARAESGEDIGYAMTFAELSPVSSQAPGLSDPVSTGDCVG